MSETKDHTITDCGARVGEDPEAALAAGSPCAEPLTLSDTGITITPTASDINLSSAAASGSGDERTANSEKRPANRGTSHAVKLCHHIKEDGVYCQIPALRGRQYCYRHLRLRGQQMRIARALAQRQTYHLVLPPLEDMNEVQSALVHVTAALAAGLLERRHAGQLLYALQQAANNLRFQARAQAQAQSQSRLAPETGQTSTATEAAGPQRVVEEYPQFEAEFGLPAGLDLTLPPQVAFPPSEKANNPWGELTNPQPRPANRWTKEDIEMEELDNRRSHMGEESYSKESRKWHDKVSKKIASELRKEREAEWEAEAARRNAQEEEKSRLWRSMDAAQQRAYWLGVRDAHETAERDRREEAAQAKKPAAKVGREEAMGEACEPPEIKTAK